MVLQYLYDSKLYMIYDGPISGVILMIPIVLRYFAKFNSKLRLSENKNNRIYEYYLNRYNGHTMTWTFNMDWI